MTVIPVRAAPMLEDVAAERGAEPRDCRTCRHFDAQGDGLGYGWCRAHAQFVKLYHPAGEFFSQCQFKALARDRNP
jgi:hypothetical protein